MEPTMTIGTALKILGLVRSSGVVQKAWAKLKKKHRFVVFGSSGTGKSNLLSSIDNPLASAISRHDRTKANRTVPLTIAGEPFVFVDTPGQEPFRDERDKVIQAAQKEPLFRRKRFRGILNVVSYGYHEAKETKLSNVFEDDLQVKEVYLAGARQWEIEQVDEWFRLLARPDRVDWIITVVTKADLWWEKQDEVLEYYKQGQYGEKIKSANVPHRVFSYCSVLHKFYEKQPLPGFLDDDGKRIIQAQFFKDMLEITGNELKV